MIPSGIFYHPITFSPTTLSHFLFVPAFAYSAKRVLLLQRTKPKTMTTYHYCLLLMGSLLLGSCQSVEQPVSYTHLCTQPHYNIKTKVMKKGLITSILALTFSGLQAQPPVSYTHLSLTNSILVAVTLIILN